MRVFDLSLQSNSNSSYAQGDGPVWHEHSSASCQIRQFNCHSSRVKRIQTEENSPDVFLTCSEDGTVRQHDLRTTHVCGRRCPPPLVDYSRSLEFYSLSLSKLRPELFVCAGTSPLAFLHDRRFGRAIDDEWGVPPQQRQLSQCVRKFTLPNCRETSKHITACKMSDDASDLLVSWSDGPIARFDVFRDLPGVAVKRGSEAPLGKRKRDADGSVADSNDLNTAQSLQAKPNSSSSAVAQGTERASEPAGEDPRQGHLAPQKADHPSLDATSGTEAVGDPDIGDSSDTEGESYSDYSEVVIEEGEDDPMYDPDMDDFEEESEEDYDPLPKNPFLRYLRDPCPDVPLQSTAEQTYTGHCNSRTVKDVNFLFGQDKVASGSDDGRLFIWDKKSAKLLNILKGDDEVVGLFMLACFGSPKQTSDPRFVEQVNVMQSHPFLPVVACSG